MENTKTKDDLSSIKEMMEKSSKFSCLSGFSIVLTGMFAIIGAVFVFFDIGFSLSEVEISYSQLINEMGKPEDLFSKIKLLVIIASIILILSLIVLYFSAKSKSFKEGINLFNPSFGRTLKSLFIPLLSGGIFSLFLINHHLFGLVAPATLIFYGLGLISASKHSYQELETLGYLELILGITASYFMGTGLVFWVIGFGFGHLFLGFYIHFKYDRDK
jgi:hypothetical protein